MILPSSLFKTMLDKVTGIERSNSMNVILSFHSYKDPNFLINEVIIEAINLKQDFYNNTTDGIKVIVSMNPSKIMELNKNQSDLYATLIIEYVDAATGSPILKEAPLVFTYRVFVHDLENLAKRFGINTFTNTESVNEDNQEIGSETKNMMLNVNVDLIGASEYAANRSHFHGILSNVTIEEAIKISAVNMGISKINMIPADNTTKYRHLIIPPEYGDFAKIFEFFQFKYGIYNNGIRAYISEGTLYIYPPFEMNLNRRPKLTILKAAPNSYLGSDNYHDDSLKDELVIVSGSKIVQQNLSNVSAENDGNSMFFLKSDEMIDGQINHNSMKLKDNTLAVTSKMDNSITSRSAVAKYNQPTINVFAHASKLAEGTAELVGLIWDKARPYYIKPGTPINFIFDDKEIVKIKHGIVESVDYNFTRQINKGDKFIYNCTASLMLRMELDVKVFEI